MNRAVKFAKENPWIFRGMAAGAVVGLAVAGPAGMVLGAQAGALAGTVAQVSVRAIQNRRLAAKGSPHSSTSATEATSGMSTAVQDAARPQTPTASTDRSRSRQLGGPEYMEARLAGPIMSGQVAAIAARRASGTSSTAPSVTGTVWAPPSRPVTPVAKSPRRS
ncbi:hypothetical protein ABZ608_36640 [Streptomyces sp. NPDC013172]|uniref:hypothetical protein n=1 Tax=Streptomyces sp. NPDC013172 TaxID=3155009 RepID=UPI0033E8B468